MTNQPPNSQNKIIKISLIALNSNSIISTQKRDSLLQILNKQAPDFVLLGETKLNNRHNISYANYTIHRTDRPNSKQGGGTAILVKK